MELSKVISVILLCICDYFSPYFLCRLFFSFLKIRLTNILFLFIFFSDPDLIYLFFHLKNVLISAFNFINSSFCFVLKYFF